MKVLEEFWYGNINPMERPFQSQRKFDKVFRLLTKNEEELLKNLNEQEKELFNKVKACYDEMMQITECQTFIKGFKLGARFFMECFENDADIFDEWNSSMSVFLCLKWKDEFYEEKILMYGIGANYAANNNSIGNYKTLVAQ